MWAFIPASSGGKRFFTNMSVLLVSISIQYVTLYRKR